MVINLVFGTIIVSDLVWGLTIFGCKQYVTAKSRPQRITVESSEVVATFFSDDVAQSPVSLCLGTLLTTDC